MATPKRQQRTLSIDRIVATSIELADRHGLDALSMRGLAGRLDVTAMSLYNHVANKDALIDLMLEVVVVEIVAPDIDKPWRDMMRRRAISMRKVLLSHPWAARILVSRISLGDAAVRDIDVTTGCLVTNGFTYAQADWARNAINNHVYGFILQELNFPVEPNDYRAAAAQYLPAIDQHKFPFMYAGALEIIEGTYDGILNFEFGLDLILEGLERWIGT